MKHLRFTIFPLFLLLSSCGYHSGLGSTLSQYESLSIPYAVNDSTGELTKAVIYEVNQHLDIPYVNSGGQLELLVDMQGISDDSIGYRRDREKDNGEVKRHIVASEGRRTITALVSVVDSQTRKAVLGPFRVQTYADYDYVDQNALIDLSFINSRGQRETVLRFSLGQLESIDSAKEAASEPLFRSCAQKIVDVISSEW